MNDRTNVRAENPELLLPVRVIEIAEGGAVFFRGLSACYRGLLTHFIKGQGTQYCRKELCPAPWHKERLIWKGYLSGETHNFSAERWEPGVLELTESLELDFRGIYCRGQVWEIKRGIKVGRTNPPLVGRLHEQLNEKNLPPAFDYMPVLHHLYRVAPLDLTAKNPLPPRMLIAYSKDAAPTGTGKVPEKELTQQQRIDLAERMRKEGFTRIAARFDGKTNGAKPKQ